MTDLKEKKHKDDTPIEKIVLDRTWNKRPDGFAVKCLPKRSPVN